MSQPDWCETLGNKPGTMEELVTCALTKVEGDLDRNAVCVLHDRSPREVLDTAKTLSTSQPVNPISSSSSVFGG